MINCNQTIAVGKSGGIIAMGVVGNFNARQQSFDISFWQEKLGPGQLVVALLRPGDSIPYAVSDVIISGSIATWTFSETDTAKSGYGKVFLTYSGTDFKDATTDYSCFVAKNSAPTGEVPSGLESWYQDMLDAAAAAKESETAAAGSASAAADSAAAAEAAQQHGPMIGENGNWWLWDTETEAFTDSNFPARGSSGAQGPKGDRGETGTIPDSAWIRKTAAGDPVVFSDGADGEPVKSLHLTVPLAQSGSGIPSPENIRPFVLYSGITLYHSGSDTENLEEFVLTWPDATATGSIGWGELIYRGGGNWTLNVLGTIVDLSARTWYERAGHNGFKARYEAVNQSENAWCSCFRSTTVRYDPSRPDDSIINYTGNYENIEIKTSRFASVSDFVAYLKDIDGTGRHAQAAFRRNTPTTCDLTTEELVTFLGANRFWASNGAAVDTVTYRADAALAHALQETELAAVRAMLAGVEASGTATRNYTVGELLISGDTLYKVTENIASGSAITEGVNVSETTVAAEIALAAASGGGGSGGSVTVDSALSASSTNPVQNKAIKAALDGKGAAASIPAAASVSAAGVLSFANSAGTQLFTVQLPLYAGGVS